MRAGLVGRPRAKESGSFLKKRTKKLLLLAPSWLMRLGPGT
jgi:hypothetical protein